VPYGDREINARRVLNCLVDTETLGATAGQSVALVRFTPLQLPPEQASGTIDHVKGRGAPFEVFGCLGNTL
jgi:hypothetical protein